MEIDPLFPPRPTALVQNILRAVIRSGALVIDATAGNGHDTAFLADCVGPSGRVLAFDIQEEALASARTRVSEAGWVEFYHQSHTEMHLHATLESAALVMFNLGYLPGENHDLTTQTTSTLAALKTATTLLMPGGILSVICYPGHPAGATEAVEVEAWMTTLSEEGWRITKYGAIGTRRPAPFLLLAAKALMNRNPNATTP